VALSRNDQLSPLAVEPRKLSRAAEAATVLIELAETRPPGSRLGTKAELRQLCDVSVGTFNEALKLVQSRGSIVLRPGPGGGLFVREQSPIVRLGNSILALDEDETSVGEAVRLRNALDPLLIDDALEHATEEDFSHMRRALADMGDAAESNDSLTFVRANWKLHAAIADASPQRILRNIYLALLRIVEQHTLSVLPSAVQPLPEYINERYRLHCDLVDAIASRDQASARELIARHNTDAG
jgi:DNA-binding FadR family transcriptional regulator